MYRELAGFVHSAAIQVQEPLHTSVAGLKASFVKYALLFWVELSL